MNMRGAKSSAGASMDFVAALGSNTNTRFAACPVACAAGIWRGTQEVRLLTKVLARGACGCCE